MSNLKVLQLDSWMTLWDDPDFVEDFLECISNYTEITPILGRPGRYQDRGRKLTWFEVNGKAYLEKASSFLYDLDFLNHRWLTAREIKAMQEICGVTLDRNLRRQLQMQLSRQQEYSYLRDLRRGVK